MNLERTKATSIRALAVFAFAGATLLAASLVSPAKADDQSVSIQNLAYSPASVTISVGDTVTWTNNESGGGIPHTVTSNTAGVFDSGQINEGGTFAHTFTSAGTFAYHCEVHPEMAGTVVVQAATGGNGAQPTNTPAAPSAGTGSGAPGGASSTWLVVMVVAALAIFGGATAFAVSGRVR